MKKYFVIYNPTSGKELAGQKIFSSSQIVMENEAVEFTFFATKKKGDGETAAIRGCEEGYDMIISCGGDGTVHEVLNGIMKSSCRTKLAVMPAGTVNDFAAQLKIPKAYANFASLLMKQNFKTIDVGKINDNYFVNVVGGGAFMNIPHDVTVEAKTILGKYAYYFKAAFEVPGQLVNTNNINYNIDGVEYNINTLLFLVINSSGAGGFNKLCPKAKIDDGLLDIVIFEKANNADLLQIFTRVFNGQHITHPKVHYMQGKNIKIDCEKKIPIDTDGDIGGVVPAEISSVHNAIEILVP
ncbi:MULTISPECIES: diacylglycerol/lipid kinase family protein [unclassified Sedimentibacter]|uniref:diacylglycerol/lipid kinase family protein n=1 Tax=unclassified Sedimentibacter TaxID=2649220 RepID=UPI0027E01CFC|nr:YegS/Rv2252/BmrU family lipid kinase [Sedimentibacter sp. MB35-C1]WMJ77617.1 YegS/Rv2252/BmrU family lipid kinase [Sedimentibacter sp. MB35-C1]